MDFPVTNTPRAIPDLEEGTSYVIQNRSIDEVNVAFSDTMPESTSQDAALLHERGDEVTFSLDDGEYAWVWGWPGFVFYKESL